MPKEFARKPGRPDAAVKDPEALSFGTGNGSKLLAPETIVANRPYSFTFNPRDQPVRGTGQVDAWRRDGVAHWWDDQLKFLNTLRYCKVRLYCEVSATGRFHFHGLIRVIKPMFFSAIDVPKLVMEGHCDMDTITTVQGYAIWDAYCRKGQLEMNDLLLSELYGPKTTSNKGWDKSDTELTLEAGAPSALEARRHGAPEFD